MGTRVVALGLAALLALAGCGGSPKAAPTPAAPTTSDAGTPSSAPSPSAAKPTFQPTPAGWSSVTVGKIMSIAVPKGWVAIPSPIVGDDTGNVCLSPRRGARNLFGCGEIEIDFGSRLPGAENSSYAPNVENGWYHATDVSQCPFLRQDAKFVPLQLRNGFDQGLKPVGAHQADWNRWTATCAGHTMRPQAWYLPKSKVVIFDYFGHSVTPAILASATFAADGNSMPAYVTGHLVSTAGSSIVIRPFQTFTNDAVGKAYAKAHGIEYPFPNDYYDADDDYTRTIVIRKGTSCVGNVELGKGAQGESMPCSTFLSLAAKHKGMPMGFWVRLKEAQTAIEIFRP